MKKGRLNPYMLCALLWLSVSTVSMFSRVITYTAEDGTVTYYSLPDFIEGTRFAREVLSKYTGTFQLTIPTSVLTVLACVAVAAILMAFIGLLILSRQRPTARSLALTVTGLVGSAVPSVLILAAVLLSKKYFLGEITCGIYPVLTPLAMAGCIWLVCREKRRQDAAQKQQSGSTLIRPAGDL